MPTLHLTYQGARLRLRAGRFLVETNEGKVVASLPARKVRRVVVHGNVGLTTPALIFLLRQGAPVYFLSQHGQYYGVASAQRPPAPDRIERQLMLLTSPRRLQLARSFVRAKLASQREYLRRNGAGIQSLEPLSQAIEDATATQDLEQLRGVEGNASRHYFQTAGAFLSQHGFHSRNRRPPRDPVNAALSYGYAILLATVASAIESAELHPEIGISHTTSRRKPALALDLMEEFRVPVVDISVFNAFRRNRLTPEATETRGTGVFLNDLGRKRLLEILEERFAQKVRHPQDGGYRTYEEMIFMQAQRLAGAIVHGKPYQPFYLLRG